MMRTPCSLAALLLLAASRIAAAQPVSSPSACHVDIVRAPDDVRQVVQEWVAAEPRCGAALEVRIVPTDGGLYVVARDERGRTRDRVVPDATSAGVLIVSWAADDAPEPPAAPPPAPVVTAAPAPVAAPPPPPVVTSTPAPVEISPPGATPELVAVSVRPAAWSRPGTPRLTLGGLIWADGRGAGVRASGDLWSRGRWSIGLAGAYVAAEPVAGMATVRDVEATAYVARAFDVGRVAIAPSVGVGMRWSDIYAPYWDITPKGTSAMSTIGQGAVIASLPLARGISLSAGPVVTVYPDPWSMNRNVDVAVLAGLGWRP